jgi:hypothetical protein
VCSSDLKGIRTEEESAIFLNFQFIYHCDSAVINEHEKSKKPMQQIRRKIFFKSIFYLSRKWQKPLS